MVGHCKLCNVIITSGHFVCDLAVDTDSLTDTLCDNVIGGGIKKLILK